MAVATRSSYYRILRTEVSSLYYFDSHTAHSYACPSSRFVSWMAVAGSSHQIPLLTDHVALYLDSSPALLLCVSQLPLRLVAFL